MGISLGLSESAALFSMGREAEAARLLDRLEPWVQTSGGPNRATWLLNWAAGRGPAEEAPRAGDAVRAAVFRGIGKVRALRA